MLGLEDYRSSDEEDGSPQAKEEPSDLQESGKVGAQVTACGAQNDATGVSTTNPATDERALGPALGPSKPLSEKDMGADETLSAPQSPYSSAQLLVRNLTMPPVPNFDIPDSPPGSPPRSPTDKFARFLELKKQGIHFNEKLEKSSPLKNPSLLPKLMDFAGIDEQDQYASTLPSDLAVPTSFPAWAYAEELAKAQQEVMKKREEEKARGQREAIDFVPATASSGSSREVTPGGLTGKGMRGSAAERVMAGLDRERPRSPLVQGNSKEKETDRRKPRNRFDVASRHRSRSRSPRRDGDRPR